MTLTKQLCAANLDDAFERYLKQTFVIEFHNIQVRIHDITVSPCKEGLVMCEPDVDPVLNKTRVFPWIDHSVSVQLSGILVIVTLFDVARFC